MAWTTPKTNFNSNDGFGFADINATNSNIDFIWETGIKPDEDATWEMGRGKFGFISGNADRFFIGHYDNFSVANASLNFSNAGATVVNAASGQSVFLRNANSTILQASGSSIIVSKPLSSSTSSIDLNDKTTISGSDTTLLEVGLDLDKNAVIGRGKLGFISGESDRFFIGHIDNFSVANAGINLSNAGGTVINASTGQSVFIRNNNSTIMEVTGTGISSTKTMTISSGTVNTALTLASSDSEVYLSMQDDTTTAALALTRTGNDLILLQQGTGNINANTNINPTTTPTISTFSVTETATLIPRGLYNITHLTGAATFSIIETWNGTSWNVFSAGITSGVVPSDYGCFVACSGTDVRIRLSESGTSNIKYQKY